MIEGSDHSKSQNEELTTKSDSEVNAIDISSSYKQEEKFESLEINVEKENILNKDRYYEIGVDRQPWKIGNTFAFCYKKGDPIFVIGPHCNIFILLYLNRAIFPLLLHFFINIIFHFVLSGL